MASYTALLKLTQPDLGATGWGTTVNSGVTALVEQAVAGAVSVAVTTAGPNTLSAIASGASSDARNQFIILTGTLSGPATLTVPAAPGATSSKLYFIKNSAGDAVTVETSGGTSVSVPNGKSMMLKVTTAGVEEAMTHAASLTLGTALAATSGGTGQSSYTIGDLLYASSTTALTKLAAAAVGNVLRAKGTGTAPAWEKADLTTDVTGILPPANGGTGLSSPGTLGNVLRSDGAGNWTSGTLASATTSAEGLVELATDAEVQAGTDTTRAITPDALRKGALVFDTVKSPTSGTTADFTSIPSWVKRITVIFDSLVLSTNSASLSLQLGVSGTPETTSYNGAASYVDGGGAGALTWAGTALFIGGGNGADGTRLDGFSVLTRLSASSNTWALQSVVSDIVGNRNVWTSAGTKSLAGSLDMVRVLIASGTFSSGNINIMYE